MRTPRVRVPLPNGFVMLSREQLSLAVQLADDEALTIVRSNGRRIYSAPGNLNTYAAPVDGLRDYKRAGDWLVLRGVARRLRAAGRGLLQVKE